MLLSVLVFLLDQAYDPELNSPPDHAFKAELQLFVVLEIFTP